MNREQYNSDPRYAKVLEQMDLLGIMDITTTRQHKNGTIVWKLPIKNDWYRSKPSYIEVASFSTGYVRNQNSCYSNYQLNKTYFEDEYFKDYDWVDGEQKWNGKYRKFNSKKRVLIPIEIDRLEYLISYCLKNYYIKNANQVVDGKFVPKWRYDNLADAARLDYENKNDEVADFQRESDTKIRDLENKLDTIKRIADYETI